MAFGSGIGSTLTSGIQDISALLPLLGTEQCEEHVSSALENGYFYAAVAPMSIFGSLGTARAGFKAAVAGINISSRKRFKVAFAGVSVWIPRLQFSGAKGLADMGLHPLTGSTLSLIMMNASKGNHRERREYLVESRLKDLLKELRLEKSESIEITLNKEMWKWNLKLMLLTSFFCCLSVTPYIFLNMNSGVQLSRLVRWTFPVLRAAGGFLTVTMTQLVIQCRIISIAQAWMGRTLLPSFGKKRVVPNQPSAQTNISFYVLLLTVGIIATVVGYIGSFSIVQSSTSTSGPISWFALEAGLSVIRIMIWGCNPSHDHPPPLQLILTLRNKPPAPTCIYCAESIDQHRYLPLARASEFIESVTSFAGLIEHFDSPDITLYYTLTRETPQSYSGLRKLYITIFYHKERITRIYTQDRDHSDRFYFADYDSPLMDHQHQVLETKLGTEIWDPMSDPVLTPDVQQQIKRHYASVINHIHYRICEWDQSYIIENRWTFKTEDTINLQETPRCVVINQRQNAIRFGRRAEDMGQDSSAKGDYLYFEMGEVDKKRQTFIHVRNDWIQEYMLQAYPEPEKNSQDATLYLHEAENVNYQIIEAICVEVLVLWETDMWELSFLWKSFNLLQDSTEHLDKIPAWRDMRASSFRRIELAIEFCNERTRGLDQRVQDSLQSIWDLVVRKYEGDPRSLLQLSRHEVEDVLRDMNDLNRWKLRLNNADKATTVHDLIVEVLSVGFCSLLPRDLCMRVRAEKKDAKKRLQKGLEGSCEHFIPLPSVVSLRHWTQSWLCPDRILTEMAPELAPLVKTAQVGTNSSVWSRVFSHRIEATRLLFSMLPLLDHVTFVYIKSLKDYTEVKSELLEAISAIPSLTSMIIGHDKSGDLAEKIYLSILEKRTLVSLVHRMAPRNDDQRRRMQLVQEVVDRNLQYFRDNTDRTMLMVQRNNSSISSLGAQDMLVNTEASSIIISFVGPVDSYLEARLRRPPSPGRYAVKNTLSPIFYSPDPKAFVICIQLNGRTVKLKVESSLDSGPTSYVVNLYCEGDQVDAASRPDTLHFIPGERNELKLLINEDIFGLETVELLKDDEPWNPISEWSADPEAAERYEQLTGTYS